MTCVDPSWGFMAGPVRFAQPTPQQTTKHPAVAIRGEVLRDAFEAIPFVRAYRRYQQECISRARCRYPDDTRNLTDGEVWRNLVTPDSSGG